MSVVKSIFDGELLDLARSTLRRHHDGKCHLDELLVPVDRFECAAHVICNIGRAAWSLPRRRDRNRREMAGRVNYSDAQHAEAKVRI